jgi:tryptophan synthase alpha chain
VSALHTIAAELKATARPSLVPFVTAGWPDVPTFKGLVAAAAAAGCRILEIGVPFSDPVADGPAIQAASAEALAAGMTLPKAIALAGEAHAEHGLEVVLMGYLNPVLSFGPERFADACRDAAVGGVIVPDLPLEESAGLRALLADRGLSLVDLVAPTSGPERLAAYARAASGFLYLVSTTGVTGAGMGHDLPGYVASVRAHAALPLYVGFGISGPEAAARVAGVADGAVIGSALQRLVSARTDRDEAVADAGRFLADVAGAMIAGRSGDSG